MTELALTYVQLAAARHPRRTRALVRDELAAEVARRIAARTARGESATDAEWAVLSELGPPVGDVTVGGPIRPRRILSGQAYLIALRVLLPTAVALAGLVFAATLALDLADGAGLLAAAGSGAWQALEVVAHTVVWGGLMLVGIDAMTRRPAAWSPRGLLAGRGDGTPALWESASSAVVWVLTVAVLGWQQVASPITDQTGAPIPVIAPGLWSWWLPVLLAVMTAARLTELLSARVGSRAALVVVSMVLDLAGGAILLTLAVSGRLLNPDLLARVPWLGEPYGPVILIAIVVGVLSALVTTLGPKYRELRQRSDGSVRPG